MNLAKSSTISSNLRDTIGTSANRFTAPLVLKIVGAFGLMAVLLVLLTVFAIFNLNQGKDASHRALDRQAFALSAQRLREAVVNERISVLNTLYTGLIDPNLSTFQVNIDSESIELTNRGLDTYPFVATHNELKQIYQQVIKLSSEGQTAEARSRWQIADLQAQKLVGIVDNQLVKANLETTEATKQADMVQGEAAGSTVLVASVIFVLIGLISFFIVARVLTPLRLLNENLTELLWSQTEHLTDRLNMLQAEININNDMMTTVRHDLKSPLSSIKGLAELCIILHPDLESDLKEHLHKIADVADGSVNTISDVLTRREQQLDLQPVQLEQMIEKVVQLVDMRYYNVQRKVEAEVWTLDPGLMEHALLNLISNARKFSMSGIGIGARKVRKPGTVDTEELEVWVWNDGAIINGEDRTEIFKPGKQTEEGKKAGGHGLGLSIVKSIAERHHGRVSVESHEKIGTTFRIFIPTLTATAASTMADPGPETALDYSPEPTGQPSAIH